jgi:hypothetical protein
MQKLSKKGRFAKVSIGRHSQVVRQRSAKPLFTSSNLVAASNEIKGFQVVKELVSLFVFYY